MSYIKAENLLPPELIEEIQRYVQGSLVYIPRPQERRLGWGLKNGTRSLLDERNEAIRASYREGISVDELADRHALSPDSIKKILYRRREPRAS